MRSNITAEQFKECLDLPESYKIDGVLCYGTSYQQEAINNLQECLTSMGVDMKPRLFSSSVLRLVREFKINGKIFWFITPYGGAELSECLHLACMFGSQKNILIGSCGGLYYGARSGDFMVPTSSYGQESSVRMYNRSSDIQYPNDKLSELLYQKLSENDDKVWRGPMTTCQGALAQTPDDIKQWSNDGYYGVDMETSTLFAVSNYFSVPSAAAVYIADNIVASQTPLDHDFINQSNMRQTKKYKLMQIALGILVN